MPKLTVAAGFYKLDTRPMKVQGGGPVLQVFAGDFNIIKHAGDIKFVKRYFKNVAFNNDLVISERLS
jgi:hypothetical protein